jgi:hypothetical protein
VLIGTSVPVLIAATFLGYRVWSQPQTRGHKNRGMPEVLESSPARRPSTSDFVRPNPKVRSQDYRETLLDHRLEKYKDHPDDSADERDLSARLRKDSTDFIRRMPPGPDGWELLYKTFMFFEGDVFDAWDQCVFASEALAKDEIVVDPLTILRGAYVAVRPNEFQPEQIWVFRHYIREYEASRKEYLSHELAVRKMINEGHFDPHRFPNEYRPNKDFASLARAKDVESPKDYIQRRIDDPGKLRIHAFKVLAMQGQPETLSGATALMRGAARAGVQVEEFLQFTEGFLLKVQSEIEPAGVKREDATRYRLTHQLAGDIGEFFATYGAALGIEPKVSSGIVAIAVKVSPCGADGKVNKSDVITNAGKVIRSAQVSKNRSPLLLPQMLQSFEKMLAEDRDLTAQEVLDLAVMMRVFAKIDP